MPAIQSTRPVSEASLLTMARPKAAMAAPAKMIREGAKAPSGALVTGGGGSGARVSAPVLRFFFFRRRGAAPAGFVSVSSLSLTSQRLANAYFIS